MGLTFTLMFPGSIALIVTLILNIMMNRGVEREVPASGVHQADENANRKRRVSITSATVINADIAEKRSSREICSVEVEGGVFFINPISGDRIQTVEVPLAGLKFALISGGGESGQRTARWIFRATITVGLVVLGVGYYRFNSMPHIPSFIANLILAIFFVFAFLFYFLHGIASYIIGDDPTHLARIVRPLAEDRESLTWRRSGIRRSDLFDALVR